MAEQKRRGLFAGIASPVTLLLSACAASISTQVLESVRPPERAEAVVVAVMPGTAEAGSEWLRSETASKVTRALEVRFTDTEVLAPDEVASRLAARGLAREYASLVADFGHAGVVDPARVEQIIRAVGATHLIQLRAGYSAVEELKAVNLDGGPLLYSAKRQAIFAVARLWSIGASGPSWEAVVRADSKGGPFSRDRTSDDLLVAMALSLVERIPLAEPEPAVPAVSGRR